MADINEAEPKSDRKIPVFTVLKNGSILKNIFLVNNTDPPPSCSGSKSIASIPSFETLDQEYEEISIVGRHPDCNIMLTHPSISRFHLEIHSNPPAQKLYVVDLSSVHGTWVSEKKIKAGVRVELKEGDTVRVGGSSRVYRLHWVPLSQAYDFDNSFASVLDGSIADEKDGGKTEFQEENSVETHQGSNSELVESSGKQSLDLVLDCLKSLVSEEDLEVNVRKEIIPSAPPMDEDMLVMWANHESPSRYSSEQKARMCSSFAFPVENDLMNLSLVDEEDVFLETENQEFDIENQIPQSPCLSFGMENLFSPVGNVFVASGDEVLDVENKSPEHSLDLQSPENRENIENPTVEVLEETLESPSQSQFEKEMYKNSKAESESTLLENLSFECSVEEKHCMVVENQGVSEKSIDSSLTAEGVPLYFEDCKKHCMVVENQGVSEKSIDSSLTAEGVPLYFEDCKENQSSHSLFAEEKLSETQVSETSPVKPEKNLTMGSIWSRRGKSASVPQIQTGIDAGAVIEDKVKTKDDLISRALLPNLEGVGEEIFTPDKENFTPNARLLKSLKKGKLGEIIMHSNSSKILSSKVKSSSSIDKDDEDSSPFSDKENRTPKPLLGRKLVGVPNSRKGERLKKERALVNKRADRMPFQSLQVSSSGRSRSESAAPNSATMTSSYLNCTQTIKKKNNPVGEERRGWIMVVDISSLLDKESIKSLQLLQGLKGTRLIIPRMVIKELDYLKRQGGLFRRTTNSTSVLKWIKESMEKTNWWIQVQSSVDEESLNAPTPTALSSSHESFVAIISPTAEDHILGNALHLRKMNKDTQIVLLSNDVTMKIKAMAEGLLCETAEEFHESLVNPFSKRFLWSDSSPRGLTWSYLDDYTLRERYDRCSLKKSSKELGSAKGLKLILLHNSHYGR